jgi:hypothetical protein
MNLTGQAIHVKPKPQAKDPAHLAKVAAMPCVICFEYGLEQLSRTTVHHCIHGRYGSRKNPDNMTIPLCEGHHQGLIDTTKIALHREPEKWRARYGPDTELLSWVEARI